MPSSRSRRSWRSGDRVGALDTLRVWLATNTADTEVRMLMDERATTLVRAGCFEARVNGTHYVVAGNFPLTFGREAAVVLRGASVSREHFVIERAGDVLRVRDNDSRNGTLLAGVPIAWPGRAR